MHDLLQLMYQDGHLSSSELAALKRTSRQLGESPVRILRSLNVATPLEIKSLLQRYYGFPAATDQLIEELDDTLRAVIPADLALHYCVLPIAEENDQVFALMEDPTEKGVIKQLEFFLGKKIVPVIATVQQLSKGLCRLYGVEPGRLNLSTLLEASRGAVGTSSIHARGQEQFLDDSQPLLDDEVFRKLKVQPKKKPETARAKAQPVQGTSTDADIDPAMTAAVNLLGFRLSLAANRADAVKMATEALKDFNVSISLSDAHTLHIRRGAKDTVVKLSQGDHTSAVPHAFRALVKKIAQCSPD